MGCSFSNSGYLNELNSSQGADLLSEAHTLTNEANSKSFCMVRYGGGICMLRAEVDDTVRHGRATKIALILQASGPPQARQLHLLIVEATVAACRRMLPLTQARNAG